MALYSTYILEIVGLKFITNNRYTLLTGFIASRRGVSPDVVLRFISAPFEIRKSVILTRLSLVRGDLSPVSMCNGVHPSVLAGFTYFGSSPY